MDVYRVGVTLAMASNHPQVLGALSQSLLHVHAQVGQLAGQFNRLHTAIYGALSVTAGVGILKGLGHIVDKTKDLSHELVQLKKLGIDAGQLADVRKRSNDVMRNITGVTEVEALKTYGSTFAMLGHENALKVMEPLSKFAQVVGNTSENFERANAQLYEMVRAGDLMGKFMNSETHQVDTERLNKFLELGTKVIQATHGKVDARQWLNMAQQGAPGLSGMTDKGMATMAIVAQAMGGFRAGTALMSTFQQMVGGTMSQRTLKELIELGVIDKDKVTIGRGGHVVPQAGAVPKDILDMVRTDPLAYMKELKRRMEERGITDQDEQVQHLFKAFGRQTTQRMFHDLLRNMPQIEGERERMFKGMGITDSKAVQDKEDVTQAIRNTTAAWHNLLYSLGGPNGEAVVTVLNKLTEGLRSMTEAVKATDPETLKRLGEGIAVLGASLVAAGGVALLAALGPAGWLALGLGAAGAAFIMFKPQIEEFGGALKALGEVLKTAALGLAAEVATWPGKVGEALTSAAQGFYTAAIEFGSGVKDKLGEIIAALGAEIASWPGKVGEAITTMGSSVATAIGTEIKSWPSRIADAISEMGAALVAKLKEVFQSLIPGLNGKGGSGEGPSVGPNGEIRGMPMNFRAPGSANDNGHTWSDIGRGHMVGTGAGHVAPNAERVAYIRQRAAALGIDPNTAVRVAASEGLGRYVGDHGKSFGDFQLYTGGGLGNKALAAGINVRDPRTWKAQTDFALRKAKEGGWGPWHGWRGDKWHGIKRGAEAASRMRVAGLAGPYEDDGNAALSRPIWHDGWIADRHRAQILRSTKPPPSYAPPPREQPQQEPKSVIVNLDGHRVGQITLNAVARRNQGVNSAAGYDSRRGWAPPDLQHVG